MSRGAFAAWVFRAEHFARNPPVARVTGGEIF
jgi:hypothetical protein